VEPGTFSRIGGVNDSARLGTAELRDRRRQIMIVSGAASLISDHRDLRASGCKAQNSIRKAASAQPKQPRSAHYAAVRKNFADLYFSLGFCFSVNAARAARVRSHVSAPS